MDVVEIKIELINDSEHEAQMSIDNAFKKADVKTHVYYEGVCTHSRVSIG